MSNAPICVCGKQMVVRQRRSDRGMRGGEPRKFFGCVDYPRCDHTEAYSWELTGEDREPGAPNRNPSHSL